MTETVQTTAPATEAAAPTAPVEVALPAYTLPEAGTLTEREFLASVQDAEGKPLAVTLGKDGVSPARGRFSTLANRVLEDAKANGATFRSAKPASKPRKAKATVAPTAVSESVSEAGEATPALVGERANPVEAAAPVVRDEGQAWGFMRLRRKGQR